MIYVNLTNGVVCVVFSDTLTYWIGAYPAGCRALRRGVESR
jgi:hypothetical protein